jgi:phosphinothricin acetyltransferase
MALTIRPMTPDDGKAVIAIYREGIATGIATLETAAPDWERWDETHKQECRLVAEDDGRVVGWAALTSVSHRPCYRGVAEETIYVTADAQGRGIGRTLMRRLIEESEREGYWTLQAAIFPENEASVALHEASGFRSVGVRQRIGEREGRFHDVLLMERRSSVVGQ